MDDWVQIRSCHTKTLGYEVSQVCHTGDHVQHLHCGIELCSNCIQLFLFQFGIDDVAANLHFLYRTFADTAQ